MITRGFGEGNGEILLRGMGTWFEVAVRYVITMFSPLLRTIRLGSKLS